MKISERVSELYSGHEIMMAGQRDGQVYGQTERQMDKVITIGPLRTNYAPTPIPPTKGEGEILVLLCFIFVPSLETFQT